MAQLLKSMCHMFPGLRLMNFKGFFFCIGFWTTLIYIYIHTYIHIYIHTYIHTYIHKYVYKYIKFPRKVSFRFGKIKLWGFNLKGKNHRSLALQLTQIYPFIIFPNCIVLHHSNDARSADAINCCQCKGGCLELDANNK